MKTFTTCYAAVLLMLLGTLPLYGQRSLWTDVPNAPLQRSAQTPAIQPTKYRALRLDEAGMKNLLNSRAARTAGQAGPSFRLDIPMADGSFREFVVQESSVMDPALAAKFPNIKTYSGHAVNNPTITIKADFTEKGFHAMILDPQGDAMFIDPVGPGSPGYYMSYYKKDFVRQAPPKFCATDQLPVNIEKQRKAAGKTGPIVSKTVDRNLRTYRLALATTYEYTQFHGGTKSSALSAVVTSMNRVNGIYEKEVAIRMVLIANNDRLIYTTANDPYTNDDGGAMLEQNINTINAVVGSGNYDIGHVFSTGGGGVAFLESVCTDGKAGGVTGRSEPVGDPFDVDYVAHEIGHQFGANHTQNNNCNRNDETAFETGSGVTIMSYAGICDPNVTNQAIPAFHAISIQEIVNYSSTGEGNSCAVRTQLANQIPTANAGSNYTIPRGTPFTLTGSATDANGTSGLTYSWEQMNNEAAPMPPSRTATVGPAFRNYLAVSTPSRTFPRIQDIISNANPTWEVLSDVARSYRFRLVVRDNNAGGGFTSNDETVVTVAGNAGPFRVTAPNTAVSWAGNSRQTVTWNVAGSNAAPVSCANVNILLSTNGGTTFPITVASNVPNTGSAAITVPNNATTQARIMIRGAGNIFFDISNANFTITTGTTACTATTPTGLAASSITTSSATLRWNSVTGANYDLRYRRTSTTTWTTVARTTNSATLSGLTAGTQYEAQVRSKCASTTSAWSASVTFTTPAAIAYCTANGRITTDEYINRVAIGSINNTSGDNKGYGNFTNLSTNLARGAQATITIVPRWPSEVYGEAYRVWIDYNRNGRFTDAGEQVYSRSATTASSVSGSFTVPTSAATGATRMRVAMRWNELPSSCGEFGWGEVEDYSVNITTTTAAAIARTGELQAESSDLVQVTAYPNPAVNQLTVSVQLPYESEGVQIGLINPLGVAVLTQNETTPATNYHVSFGVRHLAKGIYFIQVRTRQHTAIKKVIVQ